MDRKTTITGGGNVMTASELRAALDGVPGDSVPTVATTLRGAVKSVTATATRAEEVPGGTGA